MIALISAVALAQSCSCSLGSSDAALPARTLDRAGGLVFAIDYGASQTGDEGWNGVVPATDRGGNSMSTMVMPGHVVQSARASATVGLPSGFSVTVGAPFIASHPLEPSLMPGDVDRTFLGDVSVTAREGVSRRDVFVGLGVGATLPTGEVLPLGSVRGGRGAVGAVLSAQAPVDVSPHTSLGAAASTTFGLYADKNDITLGPTTTLAAGARWSPREKGRWMFGLFGVLFDQGHDRSLGYVYDQTGLLSLNLNAGATWRFWAQKQRSMSAQLRGQAPIVQWDGDPWLAQDWQITAGLAIVAL